MFESLPVFAYVLEFLELSLVLLMGHFVGDFAFQSDRMAREKCEGASNPSGLDWRWWITAHGGIHAFLVAWITGSAWLGLAEWGVHIWIDFGKCHQVYGLKMDQILHLVSKLVWALLAVTAFRVI